MKKRLKKDVACIIYKEERDMHVESSFMIKNEIQQKQNASMAVMQVETDSKRHYNYGVDWDLIH